MDDKQKARLAAIGAAAILFIDWGLQVSGLQNIWTAIFLWGIAALLGIYWLKAVTTHSALARKLIAIALMFCACAAFVVGLSWIASGRDWTVATALFDKGSTASTLAPADPRKQKQLVEYFRADFPNLFKTYAEVNVSGPGINNPRISIQAYLDFQSRSSFVGYYIPMLSDTYQIAVVLADASQTTLQHFKSSLTMDTRDPADLKGTKMTDLTFTGAVYVYHENSLDLQQVAALDALYASKGLFLQLRGRPYAVTRWLQEEASNKPKERSK
jgi:hypothetical protein